MPKPRQYDEEEVLTHAMNTFWARGFAATSVEHLVAATGLNRSSLYHAFGDKSGLFMAALSHYERVVTSEVLADLERGNAGVGAIKRTFDRVIENQSSAQERWGCLMNNTATELGPHDQQVGEVVQRHLQRFEAAILGALERGQAAGEVAADARLRDVARALTATLQGLLVMAKGSSSPAVLRSVARASLASIPKPD